MLKNYKLTRKLPPMPSNAIIGQTPTSKMNMNPRLIRYAFQPTIWTHWGGSGYWVLRRLTSALTLGGELSTSENLTYLTHFSCTKRFFDVLGNIIRTTLGPQLDLTLGGRQNFDGGGGGFFALNTPLASVWKLRTKMYLERSDFFSEVAQGGHMARRQFCVEIKATHTNCPQIELKVMNCTSTIWLSLNL